MADDNTSKYLELDVDNNKNDAGELNMSDDSARYLELGYEETIYKVSPEEGEAERQKAEAERAKNEVARISAESIRETNEAQRIVNENNRITSEDARTTAETARADAEEARETAEATRVTQEASRVTEEAKRVAEWEEIKKSASSAKMYVCKAGEYDETTKVPTIEGKAGTIYLTPTDANALNQNYYEWLYVEDDKTFEKIGTTDVKLTPIDTDTIDAIAGGETKTGDEVATTTGVSYIFTKLKNLFAPLTHTHKKTDITDFDHTHTKSEVTDFDHTHLKADITDFAHVHEGDALVPASVDATTSIKQNGVNVSLEGHKHALDDITGTDGLAKKEHTHVRADVTDFEHTHVKADITDLTVGEGTLTLKQGDTELGSFSANAEDAKTIDIPAEGKGTLTIKQGESDKGTFTANATTDTTITLDEPNNATLTIKQGDTTKGTFSANADTDVSVALDEVGKGTLTIKQGETVKGTFGANATEDSEIVLTDGGKGYTPRYLTEDEIDGETMSPTVEGEEGILYLLEADSAERPIPVQGYWQWIYLADTKEFTMIGSPVHVEISDEVIDNMVDNDATSDDKTSLLVPRNLSHFIKKMKGCLASKTHTHTKADVTDLTVGEGSLTIKAGDTTKGTFSANATEDVTIDIGEATVNDGTLTIKQEGETLATFSANTASDAEVDIKHKTGSGYNHVPTGGATGNYLAWSSDGTAKWDATSNIVKDYAPLASPALTGTPTAPTATAGTNTTQIATTAYVMNLMKPKTILNGTDTNYVSAYNNRVNITNILLVKSGYNYSMDIKYTMNSSAKSAYAAGDTWNVMSVGSTLKNLIGTNPCFGIFHDNASTGDYAGMALLTVSQNYFAISSIKQLTVVDSSVYHMLLTFMSEA